MRLGRAARAVTRDVDEGGAFLFVCGAARSGTTALTHLLGGHRDVALGMERFKVLWQPQRIQEFAPGLFTPARFFDFDDGLTNITPSSHPRWARYYGNVAVKYDSATYRGDKMTRPWFETWARFPTARFVCIIRDLYDVAHSWQARATNPEDSWSGSRGARAAVVEWNRTLRLVIGAHDRRPDLVHVVEYDTVFSDERPLRRLLSALSLEWEPAIDDSFGRAHSRRLQLAEKPRELPASLRQEIRAHADWAAWEAVRALA